MNERGELNKYIGMRVGSWEVLELDIEKSATRKYYFKCKCECGVVKSVFIYGITHGQSNSCGCKATQLAIKKLKGKSPVNKMPSGEAALGLLYRSYKRRAYKRRVFKISLESFKKLTSSPCHYCGALPSLVEKGTGRYNGSYIYNGIDRYDNKLGYIESNTVPCCKKCNSSKGVMHGDVFKLKFEKKAHA